MTFTAKVMQLGKAPARVELLGDAKRPESAQHIIEFPGGAVAVTRLTDGSGYWAEITINDRHAVPESQGLFGGTARMVESRVTTRAGVTDLPVNGVLQVAVLVKEEAS